MTSFLTEKNMGFYLILASKEKKMLLPNRRHFGTLRKTLLLEVKALFSNTPYGSLFTPCEKLKGGENDEEKNEPSEAKDATLRLSLHS